ncbi:MAG: hypothetical protein L6Q84_21970 [Polyangiaceae bacterium]|nr:hypothetical protein [Polyangiaceae bacterium]
MRVAALALTLVSGCAPALSTFVPAETTPEGHVRATGGLGLNVPAGQIDDAYEVAEALADRAETQALTADEKDQLIIKTAGVMLNPPSATWEVQGRYGIHRRADVGLRHASGALRGDGRFTFLKPSAEGDLAGSVGVGLAYYTFEIPVPPPMDSVIEIDDFRRYELDVPLLFGWSWEMAHVWFGPKLLISRYSTGMSARFVDEVRVVDVSGTNLYYGGQVGAAVGYKKVWLGLELTVAGLSGAAKIDVPAAGRSIDAKFGGLVVYPTIGVLVQL